MNNNFETVEGKLSDKAPKNSIVKVLFQGIWKNNPGLCQLLGLCPLLAVTSTAVSALGDRKSVV